MSDWFTLQTLIAFLLGVMLSALVKSKTAALKAQL